MQRAELPGGRRAQMPWHGGSRWLHPVATKDKHITVLLPIGHLIP